MQFKTIDIRTTLGMEEAEKLQSQGWIIRTVGFITITLSYGNSTKQIPLDLKRK